MIIKETCQKLFDELVVNPEDWVLKWFDDYKHFTTDIREIRERLERRKIKLSDNSLYEGLKSLPDRSFEGFVWKLVGELKNGIASRGQSVISHKHLAQFRNSPIFEEFLQAIIVHPLDNELFIKFNEWWASQAEVKHNRVLVNRIFAACAPAELSTAVDEMKFNRVFFWLQREQLIGKYASPSSGDTWLARNIFLMKELHRVNRGGFSGEWISLFPWLIFEYMEGQEGESGQQKERILSASKDVATGNYDSYFLTFYSGLILGSGQHEYVVKRVTQENVELLRTATNVERFIPVVVIKALCNALDSGEIDLADLERRQNNGTNGTEHVFDKIGLNHDKFIMGYDASIIKLCEYYVAQKGKGAVFQVSSMLSALSLTFLFTTGAYARLCSAALAKRFLILTGLSGSGKTLQALSFAKWICPRKKESFCEKLQKALASDKIDENYDVHSCSALTVELINKKGESGKIIPLPVGAIEEWYLALKNGDIDPDKDPKDTRHMVGENSRYQKYIHGFYNDLKKVATAVLELPASAEEGDGPSQYELISVGADWTSNENLLGYPDALTPKSYRKPDNGALDLILRAQANPDLPHFLILDEMNLSHVERYFADFLSAMESGEAISLHDDTGEDWNGVPAKLKIPKNLFVIGTVNVDETTYMFSPKVLDRANVIEFRVSDEEMKSFLENPVKPDLDSIAGQGAQYAKAFVAAAKQKDVPLDEELKTKISGVLMEFFPALKEAGAEFGYRTAHEICRFVYFHKELSGEGWSLESAMDAAIMQKLLPKLHGSKKKLGKVLAALIRLCLKEDARPESDPIRDEVLVKENALYPSSLEKLARMRKRLAEHGFTSFAEA